MSFASGELPQPITPASFAEGDAVLFLKQENGRLNAVLRTLREDTTRERVRLKAIISAYVEECGDAVAWTMHSDCKNEGCTRDTPCDDYEWDLE